MTPRHVVIDTDAGVDDALAILLALRSPEISVEAVTTVAGNAEVHQCTRNVYAVIERAGSSVRPPVVQGSAAPLRLPLIAAPEVHGAGGLGSLVPRLMKRPARTGTAAFTIAALARRFGNRLTVVALGPLTNIARAVQKDVRAMRSVGRIVSMGGAFRVPGNTGPVAEFNYFVDPHAADIVVTSGLRLTVVPLDVTQQVMLTWDNLCTSVAKLPARRRTWFHRLLDGYMEYHALTEGRRSAYLHDPVAMAEAIRPGVLSKVRTGIRVETWNGPARGMTVFATLPAGKSPFVATGVDHGNWKILSRRIWR